jgi:hypothetical protein
LVGEGGDKTAGPVMESKPDHDADGHKEDKVQEEEDEADDVQPSCLKRN